MSNPLYAQMGNAVPQGTENVQAFMNQFSQFRQTFSGNARQQVQNLLNSGKVSQEEYNHAVQMANQLQRMMGGM